MVATHTYDDASQLVNADCTSGPCHVTDYSFDRAGRRITADGGLDGLTKYQYDPAGRLEGIPFHRRNQHD